MPIANIERDGSTVSVTTKAPHLLTAPGNAVISGVTVGGNPDNKFNGVFEVALDAMMPVTKFSFEIPTSYSGTPDLHSGFVGGPIPFPHSLTIESIQDGPPGSAPNVYLLTTRDPHCRTRNNTVRIFGVQKPNFTDSAFNGNFQVVGYNPAEPTQLTFMLLGLLMKTQRR